MNYIELIKISIIFSANLSAEITLASAFRRHTALHRHLLGVAWMLLSRHHPPRVTRMHLRLAPIKDAPFFLMDVTCCYCVCVLFLVPQQVPPPPPPKEGSAACRCSCAPPCFFTLASLAYHPRYDGNVKNHSC